MALLLTFGEVQARTERGYRLASRAGSVSRRTSSIPVQGGLAVKDLGTGEGNVEVVLTYHPALDNAPVGNLAQLGVWRAAMGETQELSFGRLRYGNYLLESVNEDDSAFVANEQGSAPQILRLRLRFREVESNIRFEPVR